MPRVYCRRGRGSSVLYVSSSGRREWVTACAQPFPAIAQPPVTLYAPAVLKSSNPLLRRVLDCSCPDTPTANQNIPQTHESDGVVRL